MNQYLKYFIYFLLGVIIYYFLFNSTNANAQKLIEGFENTTMGNLLYIRRLYIKTPKKITSDDVDVDGEAKKVDNTGIKLENYNLSNVLITLDHLTTVPLESIIGPVDKPDAPNNTSLTAPNINTYIYEDSGDIKNLNVLLPTNLVLNVAPSILIFKLLLESPEITNINTSNIEARKILTTNEFSDIQSILTAMYNVIDVVPENQITLNNSIIYKNEDYHFIFKFSLANGIKDEGGIDDVIPQPNEIFGDVEYYIIMPHIIESDFEPFKIIGEVANSHISNSGDIGSSGQMKQFDVINKKYYVLKTTRKLSDIITIFSDEDIILPLLINFKGLSDTEAASIASREQGNFNLKITCKYPDTALLNSDNLITIPDDVLPDSTPDNWAGTATVNANGVIVRSEADTEDQQEIRRSFEYDFKASFDLFQYPIIYTSVMYARTRAEGGSQPSDPIINSALITYRTFLVDENGVFDSLMGCPTDETICKHFTDKGENTASFWTNLPTAEADQECNPFPNTSPMRGIHTSAGSCYDNAHLCCQPSGCNHYLLEEPELCSNQNKENNYFGDVKPDDEKGNVCCGAILHGYVEDLFNEIKYFNDTIFKGDTNAEKTTRSTIHRKHILYYIYGSLLDLTKATGVMRTTDNRFGYTITQDNLEDYIATLSGWGDRQRIPTNWLVEGVEPVGVNITSNGITLTGITENLLTIRIKGFDDTEDGDETSSSVIDAVRSDGVDAETENTFPKFFENITTSYNNGAISDAIGGSVVAKNMTKISDGYKNFIRQYITQNDDITDSLENELKINLILLNVLFPAELMGGTRKTPFDKVFPMDINIFNKSLLALYL